MKITKTELKEIVKEVAEEMGLLEVGRVGEVVRDQVAGAGRDAVGADCWVYFKFG